jgi:hypothetical protein
MRAKGLGPPNRNFWLGVYNGILVNGGEAFFHSSLVLAPFLATLGAPGWAIGAIPALRIGGWFLPQLWVASRLAHQPFKLPVYRRASTVRITSFAALTTLVFVAGDRPGLLIAATLAALGVNAVAGGIGGVPFADVTAKVVPHYRLGTFWVLRNAIGGVLALIAGWTLSRVLASDLPFPRDFGVVFVLGSVLLGSAYLAFALVREPAGAPALREPLRTMLRRLPAVLRADDAFRRYLRVRFLALAALLAEPFYAVHAITDLGAPATALGGYIVTATFASIAMNFAVRRAADRARNVTVLQLALVLLLAAPALALVVTDPRVFGLVFALSAAGTSAMGVAAWNLLYAVSPADARPLYVGVANSVLALPSLAPIGAGLLVAPFGFGIVFGLAALLGGAALAFSFRFVKLRDLDRAALARDVG